ncbi:nucleoid-associated protein [Duganella sacchari]|uniref:Nucleoid-associated protein n=2 Tax=Duganella sacchari TaxID=551987 RepID=A0A1M7RF86_9BURK|nr:nucleoid-associated protein [Duganella sacchari]
MVQQLISEYAKRTGKAHGRFEVDEVNYPVQAHIRQHFVDRTTTYLELSSSMMATLCAKAKGTAATPGGVIIAHTEIYGAEFLIVAIVSEEWAPALNKEMEVEGGQHLDMKGFRFAGRVNLTEWQSGGDKYLSFLRGKGQQVSAYFKAFLGCDSSVTDAAETRNLKDALDEFVKISNLDEQQTQNFYDKAFSLCDRLHKERLPIDFGAFANELWPTDPSSLTRILSEPDRKLSDGFVPDKRVYRAFVQFSGKTKTWKVEFSREAIKSGEIVFNQDETLSITNIPPELKDRLRSEVKDQDE